MTKRHEYSSKIADPRQLSLPFAKTKTILGFTGKARHGKDTVAKFIAAHYAHKYHIEFISFADGLRAEVNAAMRQVMQHQNVTEQAALEVLCFQHNVPYERDAATEANYPFGKQRKLLQFWGTELRRSVDYDYWVKQWKKAVDASNADIIISTDVRFKNELKAFREVSGTTIRVSRPGYQGLSAEAAAHVSETELDGATFDHHIVNNSDLPALQATAIQLFDHIISQKESL